MSVIRIGASSWTLLASMMIELFSCFATGIAVAIRPAAAERRAHQAMRQSSIAGCGLGYINGAVCEILTIGSSWMVPRTR